MPRGDNKIEMIGIPFGRLTAISSVACGSAGRLRYKFSCSCGGFVEASGTSVRQGDVKSCGCLRREGSRARMTIHGHNRVGKKSKEYEAWASAIKRCENPKDKHYSSYGGRGIKFCARWRHSFANFISDMGPCPPGLTLDREDNNRDYEPGNCRWATVAQQSRNKSNNVVITHNGETKILKDWAAVYGISYHIMRYRLQVQGMAFDEAIAKSVGKHVRKS